jgi:hypothetical protein
MKKSLLLSYIFILVVAVVLSGCGGGKTDSTPTVNTPKVDTPTVNTPTVKKICIIKYYEDVANLATYLEGQGYEVVSMDVPNLSTVADATLSSYNLFIITQETGQWNGEDSPIFAEKILNTGKPCLGLGGGGLGLFRYVSPQISLRLTNGAHNGFCYRVTVVDATDPLWTGLTVTNGQIIDLYTDMTVNGHGVPIANLSASADPLGNNILESPAPAADCAILAREGRFFSWGFTGDPTVMTPNGRTVFRNALSMLLGN